jgi:TonB family protein
METYGPAMPILPPVTKAPVSYELHEVRVQTLPDGTHIIRILRLERFWRDSQGRTRLERSSVTPVSTSNAQTPDWPTADIADPVSGLWYVLEQEKKIAHRGRLPAPSSGPSISFEPRVSDQETRTINGVLARGGRRTMTIPKNTQGNDRDLVITTEIWTSPELHLTLFMETQDPRVGDTTVELENFSRAEPDAALFAPPADFRIVDENGEFTVTWGAQPPVPPPPPPPPPGPPSQGVSGGAYRIGGGVSPPVPIHQVEPGYTEEARRAGIQGVVLLSIVVDENGQPQSIRVTRSLDPGLDQKAIEALSQWRFRPGQKDGKPVPVMASVQLNFRIADRPNQ